MTTVAIVHYTVPPASGNRPTMQIDVPGQPSITINLGDVVELTAANGSIYLIRFDRKPIARIDAAEALEKIKLALEDYSPALDLDNWIGRLRRLVGLA